MDLTRQVHAKREARAAQVEEPGQHRIVLAAVAILTRIVIYEQNLVLVPG
jgi:hypothetical protein